MPDKQNKDNQTLLQAVAANAEMGQTALEQLVPMAEDGLFRAELLREKNEYCQFGQEAQTCLAASGEKTQGQSVFAKANAKMGISMKTLTDKSTRNMAEMVAEGAQQGVIDCIERIRDCPGATPGAKRLAQRLQDFEQDCAQRMQSFL